MVPASRLPSPSSGALLLLPLGVLLNGALFWPAACLVALGAARDRQHGAMLVWYGLALGFDAQALILAPLVAAVLIGRRVRPALLPIVPLFAALMLLARAGPDGFDATLVLPRDVILSNGAPSIWAIAQALPWIDRLPLTGLAITTALGAAAAFIAWFSARPLDRHTLPPAALLCALVLPALWPGCSVSAFLLADALALSLALSQRSVATWRIAGLVLTGALLAAIDGADLAPLGAVAMLLATVLHARGLLKPAANDNPLLARAA